jgi:hypothetical protein
MTDENDRHAEDVQLQRALRRWEMKGAPEELRRRVIASYDELHPRSPWKRLWRMRVSMPAPVAAALLILLVAASAFAGRIVSRSERPPSHVAVPADGRRGLADLKPLPEIRVAVIKGGESYDAR